MEIDQAKLEKFLGQAVGEMGAAMNAALVLIGDKLGLYKAMAGAGAVTPDEVAQKTGYDRALRPGVALRASCGRVRPV